MHPDTEHNSENESKAETDDKAEKSSPSNKDAGTKRRTKTGCLTCRRRRIKCGEERPVCKNCVKSKRECAGYNQTLFYKQHGQPYPQSVSSTALNPNQAWSHNHSQSTNQSLVHTTSVHSLASVVPNGRQSVSIHGTEWQVPVNDPNPYIPTSQTLTADFNTNTNILPPWAHENYGPSPGDMARQSHLFHANNPMSNPIQTLEVGITRFNHPDRFDQSGHDIKIKRHNNLGFVQRPSFTSYVKPQPIDISSDRNGVTASGGADDPEDPWDIEMDDEDKEAAPKLDTEGIGSVAADFNSVLSSNSVATVSLQAQTFPTLYRNSATSPLLEEKSQNIFSHFTSVTGPCMGTYDRHDIIADSGTTRMIWTHGLPAMALDSPGLAHGMLAVSAMHMFALNLGSEHTAVKHFTHALRCVGSSLADPNQRHQVSTLATVLLLGYYEVMAGDHSRWNLHLSGAGKLVMEHNYAGMMRNVRRIRARSKTSIAYTQKPNQSISTEDYRRDVHSLSALLGDDDWKVDQDLISKLMGCDVDYDTQVQSNFQSEPTVTDFTPESMKDWKTLVELYWFYCRQDVFMSMLSGDRLLLPYSQWKYCPPRGSLGNPDKVNTTFDHLWLIIARLTDFGGKDRKRKQRVVTAQGGHWIPPPGFLHSTNLEAGTRSPSTKANAQLQNTSQNQSSLRPNANEGRTRVARQTHDHTPSQVPFYGMLPPSKGPIQMPDSFRIMSAELKSGANSSPVDSDSPPGQDLNAQTQQAIVEHTAIAKAFDLFESHLGPDFKPLPPGDIQITTPFGPALRYKTPSIAIMWTFFFTGQILLRRLHPYSPPAAMISAGVNAHFTRELAQTIGRICGGLYAQHSYLLQAGYVDHTLSAAIIETTFTLLFAAVQFQDPVQRGWTIGKLSEIAKVTGWQTAAAVAAACEATWEKAGLAGKGPLYERTMDQNNDDARLNGKWKLEHTQNTRGDATAPTPLEEYKSRFVSHDRNLINKHASTRAHWALGLLSMEEDLQRIALNDNDSDID